MDYGNGENNRLVWKNETNKYHSVDFEVDEHNPNVNVSMLAQYVKPGASVLDIGCGEGKLGVILATKECKLYGIDLDEDAARFALQHRGYKDIFLLDVEHLENNVSQYEKLQNLK